MPGVHQTGTRESCIIALQCTHIGNSVGSIEWCPSDATTHDAPLQQQRIGRSAFPLGRAVNATAGLAKKRRKGLFALAVVRYTAHAWSTAINNKGTSSCLRKPGSSQPLRPSRWLAASRPIFSAARLALLRAQSHPTRLAPIRLQPHWLAPLPVCCATTQASAAQRANNRPARFGRAHLSDRRRGFAPAAVLRSKDPCNV